MNARRYLIGLVFLTICISSLASAESGISLRRFGGQLGLVDPQNVGSTVGLAGVADLGTLSPDWHLEARLDHWSKSTTWGIYSDTLEYRLRDITIGALAKRYIAIIHPTLSPYFGIGLSYHMIKGEIKAQDNGQTVGQIAGTDSRFGLDLCGGTEYTLSPRLDLTAELRYRMVSDMNQFEIKFGLLYRLGS